MVYNAFLEAVRQSLSSRLGKHHFISIQTIKKNNSIVLDGLCISKTGESTAPAIYLNALYEAYQNGCPLEQIVTGILTAYENTCPPAGLSPELFSSAQQIRDNIIFRLINESANKELLREVPHRSLPGLDLSLVFLVIFPSQEDKQFCTLIYNNLLEHWKLSAEELEQAARINTPRLLPAQIQTMSEMIKNMAMEAMGDDFNGHVAEELVSENDTRVPLYVLSNVLGRYGASSLFYEGVIKDFADRLGSDLIILPSSIHEGATR